MDKFIISLFICSLLMTTLSLVYMLMARLLKNVQTAKWRYYSWILIMIGFATPFKPSFGETAIAIDTVTRSAEVGNMGNLALDLYGMPSAYGSAYYVLFFIWLSGALAVLGITLFKQHSFIRSAKRLARPVNPKTQETAEKLMIDMCIAHDIKLIVLKEVSSPMVAGLFKPILILPDRDFGKEELYLILKHELVHLKHKDLFIKAFMLICKAVHWFNPFMNIFIRKAEQECELYCDEIVTKNESIQRKKLYCHSILNTVSAQTAEKHLHPAISSNFYFNKHNLKHRLAAILSLNRKYKLGIMCAVIGILVFFGGKIMALDDGSGSSSDADVPAVTTTFSHQNTATESTYTFTTATSSDDDRFSNTSGVFTEISWENF